MFTDKDIKKFNQRGISIEEINKQISLLQKGFHYVKLIAPATTERGIIVTTENSRRYYITIFDDYIRDREIVKFVPASGAATRMFKDLFACYNQMKQFPELQIEILDQYSSVKEVIDNLKEFAFYKELEKVTKLKNINLQDLIDNKKYIQILDIILHQDGLNYSHLPKALILFHDYNDYQRTAFEEHLVEGALYAVNHDGFVNIHFTISPEHHDAFYKHMEKVVHIYEQKFGIRYQISFSYQDPSTDTISLDQNNQILRDAEGDILFRPGGHGSLLKNLNNIQGDLIFIKNIDNIVADRHKGLMWEFKKVLAGILIEKEISINGNISILMDEHCDEEEMNEIAQFITDDMLVSLPPNFRDFPKEKKRNVLINKLNKPLRVCGMVRNQGEPGGGPFFVEDAKGIISLQIVESSQIDFSNPEQKKIFEQSTHFNPVDIVANPTDYLNRKFQLQEFIDNNTCIITEKSHQGAPIRVYEHPGLWNGSMAGWITYFVEIPLETFAPVKTINDLLKPLHKEL